MFSIEGFFFLCKFFLSLYSSDQPLVAPDEVYDTKCLMMMCRRLMRSIRGMCQRMSFHTFHTRDTTYPHQILSDVCLHSKQPSILACYASIIVKVTSITCFMIQVTFTIYIFLLFSFLFSFYQTVDLLIFTLITYYALLFILYV